MLERAVLDPLIKLGKDIRLATMTMVPAEVRYLVDLYYILQDVRIRAAGQIRSMGRDDGEPHETIRWVFDNTSILERNIKSSLLSYAQDSVVGAWALSVVGIGPIIASGLLAHIDIEKTRTVSSLWSFAGLNPTVEWKKGQKRPWNARLKVLCWHAGESFKRTSGNENSVYGKLYRQRKELEVERNEAGMFADQAKQKLENFNIGKTTDAYKAYIQDKLPAGRLDLRATRYATKMFLSHFWAVLYESHYGKKPENPWILEKGGHRHAVPIPNWPIAR